jgi:hypothetical protein
MDFCIWRSITEYNKRAISYNNNHAKRFGELSGMIE